MGLASKIKGEVMDHHLAHPSLFYISRGSENTER